MDTNVTLSIKDLALIALVLLPIGYAIGQECQYRRDLRLTASKEDKHVIALGKHG